jgi:hypothetical protein
MVWLAIDLGIVLGGFALLALGRWAIDFVEARFSSNSPSARLRTGPASVRSAQSR